MPTQAAGFAGPQPEYEFDRVISLLGKPLTPPPLPPEIRAKRERELESAQFEYDRDPHNEDAIVWLGRRQAYLGRYGQAINTFTNGLAIHPDSYRLLRHRGHRYITVRQFDRALADLSRAAELITGVPDQIEPDGQPNAANQPRSTSHSNIFYHLALAQYLRGNYAAAAGAFQRCLEFATNDDMSVATRYWLYLSLRRADDSTAAAKVLEPIAPNMDIIENASYHRLLLMFKGDLSSQQVFAPSNDNQPPDIDKATLGYGVGMLHLLRGEKDQAEEQFRAVIDATNWTAFGHIAAEVELARAKSN